MVCYVLHTILSTTSKAMCLLISNSRQFVCSAGCVKRTCGKFIDPIYPSCIVRLISKVTCVGFQ